MDNSISHDNRIESRFRFKEYLTLKKLIEFIPPLLLSSLSTLLIISVDSLVVGNFVGADALASINLFYPVSAATSVAAVLVSFGAATSLSIAIGSMDGEDILRIKCAIRRLVLIFVCLISVLQIPIVSLIINSYNLSPGMKKMVWQYAIGMMISYPFGLFSSVSVYLLQSVGKMKLLMWLSIMESTVNLLLDLLFVAVLNMGVSGAGFGTAAANVLRASVTLWYLVNRTDLIPSVSHKPRWTDMKRVLRYGLPECANSFMIAVQNYCIVLVILYAFGEEGGIIKGVCAFIINVAFAFIMSVSGSARPLCGLVSGTGSWDLLRRIIIQSMIVLAVLVGLLTVLIEIFPQSVYYIHGVDNIPASGILAVRLFSLSLIFKGENALMRVYFSTRGKLKFSTILTVVGNVTLPLFALALINFGTNNLMWLSYLLTELLIFSVNAAGYFSTVRSDINTLDGSTKRLLLSVSPDEAVEASEAIRDFAVVNRFPEQFANRMSLCMEEMVAYAVKERKNHSLNIQIMAEFSDSKSVFAMIDDGNMISFDSADVQNPVVDNYGLIKRISSKVEYQYVLNLNHTIVTFDKQQPGTL